VKEIVSAPEVVVSDDADLVAKLQALHLWVSEWSGIARTVLKDRESLIKLGVLRPRKEKPPVKVVSTEDAGPDSKAA
jgi:hypothetical protein